MMHKERTLCIAIMSPLIPKRPPPCPVAVAFAVPAWPSPTRAGPARKRSSAHACMQQHWNCIWRCARSLEFSKSGSGPQPYDSRGVCIRVSLCVRWALCSPVVPTCATHCRGPPAPLPGADHLSMPSVQDGAGAQQTHPLLGRPQRIKVWNAKSDLATLNNQACYQSLPPFSPCGPRRALVRLPCESVTLENEEPADTENQGASRDC